MDAAAALPLSAALDRLLARCPARRRSGQRGAYSFREAGEKTETGETLVLLHGIGSGSASWAHQLTQLAGRRRVVAWDAPGYGESDPLREASPSAADYAAALGDFLDMLGLARVALIGHSLGALMAAAFARAQPERIAGLILASPAGGYARAGAAERERRLAERLDALATLGPAGLARSRARHLLGPSAAPAALALVEWSMARLRPEGYAQAARMLAAGDIAADLAAWPRPVLVVSGSADSVTSEANCRAVAAAAPHGVYTGISGAGHALYAEMPERFNAVVAAHLDEAP